MSVTTPLPKNPEGDVVEVLAGGAGQRDHEEQHRERHHDLRDTADHGVGPAAVEAGHRAHQDAEDHREDRRSDRDLERGLRAVEEAQELVAAELAVGAEHEERLARSAGRAPARAGVGRVGHPGQRADRQHASPRRRRPRTVLSGPWPRKWAAIGAPTNPIRMRQTIQIAAGDRELVAPEAEPDALPVAARAYRLGALSPSSPCDSAATVEARPAPEETSSGRSVVDTASVGAYRAGCPGSRF